MTFLLIFIVIIAALVWLAFHANSEVLFLVTVAAAAIVVAAAIIVGAFSLMNWLSHTSCERSLDHMGRDGSYGFIEGCVVELDNGQRIPLDNYRGIEDGNN